MLGFLLEFIVSNGMVEGIFPFPTTVLQAYLFITIGWPRYGMKPFHYMEYPFIYILKQAYLCAAAIG